MLIHDLFLILRDLCNCNLSRSDLSNISIKCDKGNSETAFINTTLIYSSPTGDEIATTIAQKLYDRALMCSSRLKIGNNVLIETVVLSNSSIQSPESASRSSATAGIGIGSFVGGVTLALICVGIVFFTYIMR